jgi:hypothetical protein
MRLLGKDREPPLCLGRFSCVVRLDRRRTPPGGLGQHLLAASQWVAPDTWEYVLMYATMPCGHVDVLGVQRMQIAHHVSSLFSPTTSKAMNPATKSRPSRTRTSRIIIGPSPDPRARRKPGQGVEPLVGDPAAKVRPDPSAVLDVA